MTESLHRKRIKTQLSLDFAKQINRSKTLKRLGRTLSLAVDLTMADLPIAMCIETFSRLRLQSYLLKSK